MLEFNKKQIITYITSLIIICLMVGASELLHEREIIFPEISAIALGALFAPVQSWNTNRPRLFLSISFLSFVGIAISSLPMSLLIKIPLGLLIAFSVLILSQISFVPLISACLLPIVIGSKSIYYPISVVLVVGKIVLIQALYEHLGLHDHREYVPIPFTKKRHLFYAKHFLILSLFMIIPVLSGEMYFMIPPLIVAYVEMSSPRSKLKHHYSEAIILMGIAAILGVVVKMGLYEYLGVSLTLCALLINAIMFLLCAKIKLYMPPCGAIATLPLLLQGDHLIYYPIEAIVGFMILTFIALTFFKDQRVSL